MMTKQNKSAKLLAEALAQFHEPKVILNFFQIFLY